MKMTFGQSLMSSAMKIAGPKPQFGNANTPLFGGRDKSERSVKSETVGDRYETKACPSGGGNE